MNGTQRTYKTNVELVVELMEFSRVGGIKQAFVLTAIEEYSRRVLASKESWDNGLINQEAWKTAAQECKTAIDEHLGRSTKNVRAAMVIVESEGV